MLNHLLVPLDGSPLAEEALSYVNQLLRPGGRLTLVMAVDLSGMLAYDMYPITGIRADVPQGQTMYGADKLVAQARTYAEKIAKDRFQYEVHIVVETGEPATLILKAAQETHAETIVMSTHGRSGFSRWLLGSVTNRVLSAATCPVFVIPNMHRQTQPEIQTREMTHS